MGVCLNIHLVLRVGHTDAKLAVLEHHVASFNNETILDGDTARNIGTAGNVGSTCFHGQRVRQRHTIGDAHATCVDPSTTRGDVEAAIDNSATRNIHVLNDPKASLFYEKPVTHDSATSHI